MTDIAPETKIKQLILYLIENYNTVITDLNSRGKLKEITPDVMAIAIALIKKHTDVEVADLFISKTATYWGMFDIDINDKEELAKNVKVGRTHIDKVIIGLPEVYAAELVDLARDDKMNENSIDEKYIRMVLVVGWKCLKFSLDYIIQRYQVNNRGLTTIPYKVGSITYNSKVVPALDHLDIGYWSHLIHLREMNP